MQAVKWATRFKRHKGKGIVTAYEFNVEDCKTNYSIQEFKGYTEEWLDFITSCRQLENTSTYDLVIGGVTNDKVFNTIELFVEGLIEKSEAIKRLRFEKPNLQMCIHNQELIGKYMKFVESEEIK